VSFAFELIKALRAQKTNVEDLVAGGNAAAYRFLPEAIQDL
jgi:hypothetical protein